MEADVSRRGRYIGVAVRANTCGRAQQFPGFFAPALLDPGTCLAATGKYKEQSMLNTLFLC